ncbi:hypothetical protein C0J52_25282 [Blattella germanica]|nr:hypothetical protein C0J52_25282 [Blattella germanica]
MSRRVPLPLSEFIWLRLCPDSAIVFVDDAADMKCRLNITGFIRLSLATTSNTWLLVSHVPVEATAFLGAVAAFVVLLLVFFLYLNKKWCFYSIGGFPCCDEPFGPKPPRSKELGK